MPAGRGQGTTLPFIYPLTIREPEQRSRQHLNACNNDNDLKDTRWESHQPEPQTVSISFASCAVGVLLSKLWSHTQKEVNTTVEKKIHTKERYKLYSSPNTRAIRGAHRHNTASTMSCTWNGTYSTLCRFLVYAAINVRSLYNARNFSITPATISTSKRVLLYETRCAPFTFYRRYPVAVHTHNRCLGRPIICSPKNKWRPLQCTVMTQGVLSWRDLQLFHYKL